MHRCLSAETYDAMLNPSASEDPQSEGNGTLKNTPGTKMCVWVSTPIDVLCRAREVPGKKHSQKTRAKIEDATATSWLMGLSFLLPYCFFDFLLVALLLFYVCMVMTEKTESSLSIHSLIDSFQIIGHVVILNG